jgi:glycosyltransferase involved in cell wall biosynthesis
MMTLTRGGGTECGSAIMILTGANIHSEPVSSPVLARGPLPTILHVLAPAEFGGLESVVHALAAGQAARGIVVHAALVVEPGIRPPLASLLADAGVHPHVLELGARAYRAERAALRDLVRETRAELVHTHGYRSDVIGGSAARSARVPVVSTVHGFIGGTRRGRLNEWVQRLALRRADAVIAVSRPLAARLVASGIASSRVHLMPNAWAERAPGLTRAEARAALGIPDAAFVVGWVGRLGREKGPDVFVDALGMLGDLPVQVSVIGEGREGPALRERTTGWGGPPVRWHGTLPGASRYFRAFDLYVLSSRTEGTPISLLEAVAAGVPAVATAVGGVGDVTGADGALLVPSDDPAALATAIRGAFEDRDASRDRAARATTRLATEFAAGPWLDRHDALYRTLLRGSR